MHIRSIGQSSPRIHRRPVAPSVEPSSPDGAAAGDWTVLNFVMIDRILGQDVYDGVRPSEKGPFTVVTATLSRAGAVKGRYVESHGQCKRRTVSPGCASLEAFLKWGMEKYPAKNYMIAFDGHSSELRPLLPAIESAMREAGRKFAIVKFGSCTMAHADIASQFQESAGYFIASQDFSYAEPYLGRLNRWGESHRSRLDSVESVAKSIMRLDVQPTNSVIDLEELTKWNGFVKALGKEILDVQGRDLRELRAAADRSQRFAQHVPDERSPLIDVRDLAVNIEGSARLRRTCPALVRAARNLRESLEDVVVGEKHTVRDSALGGTVRTASGLCLFLPLYGSYVTKPIPADEDGDNDAYLYNPNLRFWKDTGWDKVMNHLLYTNR